jgi:ATPase subunit of ABC transporter with duplicated ATPase domains
VQSRVKKLEKIERVEPPRSRRKLRFEFPTPPRSGEDVVRLRDVKKAWGQRVVYDGLDMLVRYGERWCVMGANGAGKSTLLKMVVGETTPDAGDVQLGASVKLGYFAQHAMDLLDGELTVWTTLDRAFPSTSQGALRTLAGVFGFPGDDVDKPVRLLSGGEKARLVMARMLYDPPNFLVLDEPTNHLDVDTKDLLIDSLSSFAGTMLFVSHDRHFLAALSNRVFEVDRGGASTTYGGGYTEYVEATGREAPGMREL